MLVNHLQQRARRPLLISADFERGAGMRLTDTTDFGWVMAVGATGNPDYARRMGEFTGREARALGIQQILAPVVDVNNNAANPVINVRSFGEDPVEVGRFSAAFVKGAQSNGVIATAKHFPGHGNTATDSHRGLPSLSFSLADLNKVELIPFRAAIDAGVGSVMVGHIAVPQIDPTPLTPIQRKTDGKPTYAGRTYNGMKVEGLLLNSRMVQGVFDDRNPVDPSTFGKRLEHAGFTDVRVEQRAGGGGFSFRARRPV